MKIKLSSRLAAVAGQVDREAVVADIGTDHGYLPVYLIVSGIAEYVIATDRAKGPLSAARQLVELLSLDNKIDTRLGDGLSVLEPGEADIICIAGMGGMMMIDILREGKEVLHSAKKLVLQPQRGASKLRRYLMEQNFRICFEDLVEDDGFYYVILVAEPGEQRLTERELQFGPYLLQHGHPLYRDMLSLKKRDIEQLLGGLSPENTEELTKRKAQLKAEIAAISEVVADIDAGRIGVCLDE